jgi:hypothetical protein
MRRNPTERAALVAAITLILVGVALPVSAQAQNGQGPIQAPIGHRQPRAQDLPQDVLRSEGMAQPPTSPGSQSPPLAPESSHNSGNAQSRSKLDKELQICRRC